MQDQSSSTREKKREQFTQSAAPKDKTKLILTLIAVALLAAAAYAVISSMSESATPAPAPLATTPVGTDVRIPIADLNGGKAKFFDYTVAGNKAVRFFAVKSPDGKYRAAMDACDTCYHAKKGYSQQGEDMICNQCGLKFHCNLINEVSGGCNPVGVPLAVEGDNLVIKASELESRSRYF